MFRPADMLGYLRMKSYVMVNSCQLSVGGSFHGPVGNIKVINDRLTLTKGQFFKKRLEENFNIADLNSSANSFVQNSDQFNGLLY